MSYRVPIGDEFFSVALGANNLFGNDPPTCRNSCGVIGMSPVAHDLPGTLTYLKVSYRH